jgi:hypothetical protein
MRHAAQANHQIGPLLDLLQPQPQPTRPPS